MTHAPRLLINRLSYAIPNTSVQFDDVTLSFTNQRYGIIGDNGSGKTTLLKLIAGLIKPHQGTIVCDGTMAYCPQHLESITPEISILELLDIQEKWDALHRVQLGEIRDHDFELIGDDWGLESEVATLFQHLNLSPLLLKSPFSTLSGGQKTKVLLAKTILSKADFILLDEPTNNLDKASRKILLEWIKNRDHGFIIISHDRELLGSMDEMIELTAKGIHRYGGNYSMYDQQKSLIQTGLQHQVEQAKRQVKQFESSIQTTKERHAERQKKGRDDRKSGRQGDKLLAGSMKNSSENTQSRNRSLAELRIQQINDKLQAAKSQIEIKEAIHADLSATKVPLSKNVLLIHDLLFAYTNQPPLFSEFNLSITGPERIAILGKNGSGKSTLIQLINGQIQPQKGTIQCGVTLIRTLDQTCHFLIPEISLVENFQFFNPTATEQDAYAALASFQFRNSAALKKVSDLSGGERIRAGLAISLLSKTPPQLIILDEPTNHLDLQSIQSIETALSEYQGAMIVISHDESFLKNINISRSIAL